MPILLLSPRQSVPLGAPLARSASTQPVPQVLRLWHLRPDARLRLPVRRLQVQVPVQVQLVVPHHLGHLVTWHLR
eukprot:7383818-Prymnesium_polylepis.1